MQKTLLTFGFTLALALAVTVVTFAQRGGITPDMIATALPLEGAPLAVAGPYTVESGPAFNSPGHVVYRPADLSPFPGRDTLPVMVWGNGGCAINSTRYAGFLTTIASHGFVVLATAAEPGTPAGTRATADNLRKAIAWAETENTREGSPLKGKIALFSNVPVRNVISAEDVGCIYELPIKLHEQGLDDQIADRLNIWSRPPELASWRRVIDQFFLDLEAKEILISADVGAKALDAAQQFGKIVNHPAKLNMGDCLSYACAKAYRTRLAYKGNDFAFTDIGW